MKIGIRKPSIKKSIKARTTGKLKRQVKKTVNPLYGKKGMGMINNPKKAIYNKVYNKTTIGVSDLIKTSEGKSSNKTLDNVPQECLDNARGNEKNKNNVSPTTWKVCGILMKVLAVITAIIFGLPGLIAKMYLFLIISVLVAFGFWMVGSAWTKKAIKAKAEKDDE